MTVVLRAWSVAACAALLLACSHASVRAADPTASAATPAALSSSLPSYRTPRLLYGVIAGDRTDEYGVFVQLSGVQDPTLRLDGGKVHLRLRKDGAHETALAAPRPDASPPSNYATAPPERATAFPAFVGFRLELANRAPGWYTLSADADADAIVHTDGTVFTVEHVRAEPLRVYVPRAPETLPAYAPGQHFIFLPGFIYGRKAPAFLGPRGEPEPFASYALQPLTYLGAQDRLLGKALQFATSDGRKTTIDSGDSLSAVPGLFPLVEDATSRAVAAKYVGHDVWRFGRGPLLAAFRQNSTFEMEPGKPARVLAVYRPFGYPFNAALGSSPFAFPNYVSIDPLVVVLRVRDADLLPSPMNTIPAAGPTAYWLVSDAWDMERRFSLVSMQQAHPEWNAAMRDAVVAQNVLPGMTRDMVAWSQGYPSVEGTVAAMNALDVWHFEQPPPSSSTVYFRDGRVVRIDPPGRLP
jgi:hypothetical protein